MFARNKSSVCKMIRMGNLFNLLSTPNTVIWSLRNDLNLEDSSQSHLNQQIFYWVNYKSFVIFCLLEMNASSATFNQREFVMKKGRIRLPDWKDAKFKWVKFKEIDWNREKYSLKFLKFCLWIRIFYFYDKI